MASRPFFARKMPDAPPPKGPAAQGEAPRGPGRHAHPPRLGPLTPSGSFESQGRAGLRDRFLRGRADLSPARGPGSTGPRLGNASCWRSLLDPPEDLDEEEDIPGQDLTRRREEIVPHAEVGGLERGGIAEPLPRDEPRIGCPERRLEDRL